MLSSGMLSGNWLGEVLQFIAANKAIFTAIGATGGAIGGAAKLVPKANDLWKAHRDAKFLKKRLGAESYTREEIERATDFYIQPNCQDVDPGGAESWRNVHAVCHNLFQTLDKILLGQAQYRHSILLADSGMGKTSFLLNYYAQHHRKRWTPFGLAVVPLGSPSADLLIAKQPDRENRVLFLDAFDEDTRAIQDHRARLSELLTASDGFRHVLITCRTQFFADDDEIPKETGILRVGTTGVRSHNQICRAR